MEEKPVPPSPTASPPPSDDQPPPLEEDPLPPPQGYVIGGPAHLQRLLQRQLEANAQRHLLDVRRLAGTNRAEVRMEAINVDEREEEGNDPAALVGEINRRMPSVADLLLGLGPAPPRIARRRAPIQRRRIDRDPTESLDARRRAMEIMNTAIQQLSQLSTRVIRQQQPLIQSRIQTLLGEQERLLEADQDEEQEEGQPTREEEAERIESGLAIAFSEVEQTAADIATLRPIYADGDNEVTPQQLRSLFRVFERVYFDMRDEIEELEEELEEEEPVANGGMPPGLAGALLAIMAGGGIGGVGGGERNRGDPAIGMAAALLGVATGLLPLGQIGAGLSAEDMQRMIRDYNLPADFFANVPVPMQEETLQAMPSMTYSEHREVRGADLNEECNICLTAFNPDDMVRLFPCCQNVQHTECLTGWFDRRDTCVVCKKKVRDTLNENTAEPPQE
jgi:hypothetical protein